MTHDMAASVRARLLNLAKAEGSDFNQVLVRYTLERLLYRLSQSAHAHCFVLKGALLFTLWYDMAHRPTRDADLLGFGPSDLASIGQMFRDIAGVAVEDGIVFEPASVKVEDIRKESGYGGARVLITGELAKARCRAQVDIGFGDAVTPGPVQAVFPVLLADFPAPQLRTYPVYTVIAEKLHAIALLGMTNTRLKDYLDLSVLLEREALAPTILASAIAATFMRRGRRCGVPFSRRTRWPSRRCRTRYRPCALTFIRCSDKLRCSKWICRRHLNCIYNKTYHPNPLNDFLSPPPRLEGK